LTTDRLSVCPVFEARADGRLLHLHRRPGFEELLPNFAPEGFEGYAPSLSIDLDEVGPEALLGHFTAGELSLLPNRFGAGYAPLATSTT
jgi:hypothetical protein